MNFNFELIDLFSLKVHSKMGMGIFLTLLGFTTHCNTPKCIITYNKYSSNKWIIIHIKRLDEEGIMGDN